MKEKCSKRTRFTEIICFALTFLLLGGSVAFGATEAPKPMDSQKPAEVKAGIRKLLNLPDHIIPLNIIPLGYPVEKSTYQDRFKPAKIHNDRNKG